MPTRLNDSPAVAHDKKLKTNTAVASDSTTLESLPKPRNNCAAASATNTIPKMYANCCAGKVSDVPPSVSLKPASPGRREKTASVITAKPK